VQELYHGRQTDGASIRAAGVARREEQQRRAQPLSAAAEQVRGDF